MTQADVYGCALLRSSQGWLPTALEACSASGFRESAEMAGASCNEVSVEGSMWQR